MPVAGQPSRRLQSRRKRWGAASRRTALATAITLAAAASATAPLRAATPVAANAVASAQALRDAAAISTPMMIASLAAPLRSDFDGGPAEAAAWSLFFQGAVVIAAPLQGGEQAIAFYNPAYDGAVVTRWRSVGGAWSVAALTCASGDRLRGEAQRTAPDWEVARNGPLADALAKAGTPSVAEVTAVAQSGAAGDDHVLVLARIVALQAGLGQFDARPGARHVLHRLTQAMATGKASALQSLGLDGRLAHQLATLPTSARRRLVALGAVVVRDGSVVVLAALDFPGLIFVVGETQAGA